MTKAKFAKTPEALEEVDIGECFSMDRTCPMDRPTPLASQWTENIMAAVERKQTIQTKVLVVVVFMLIV